MTDDETDAMRTALRLLWDQHLADDAGSSDDESITITGPATEETE